MKINASDILIPEQFQIIPLEFKGEPGLVLVAIGRLPGNPQPVGHMILVTDEILDLLRNFILERDLALNDPRRGGSHE